MHYSRLYLLLSIILLTGCGPGVGVRENSPVKSTRYDAQASTVDVAMQQLGAPYRYGGRDPSGFDCSGLVYYAYRQTGIKIPRSSQEQLRHSRKVSYPELKQGDLVFFRISKIKISHVGIYIGGKKFVHAPSSGKRVQVSSLNDPYWQRHFVSGGRI